MTAIGNVKDAPSLGYVDNPAIQTRTSLKAARRAKNYKLVEEGTKRLKDTKRILRLRAEAKRRERAKTAPGKQRTRTEMLSERRASMHKDADLSALLKGVLEGRGVSVCGCAAGRKCLAKLTPHPPPLTSNLPALFAIERSGPTYEKKVPWWKQNNSKHLVTTHDGSGQSVYHRARDQVIRTRRKEKALRRSVGGPNVDPFKKRAISLSDWVAQQKQRTALA